MLFFLLCSSVAAASYLDECLSVPYTICLDNGSYVLGDLAEPDSLVGWWTFDDKFGHDYSSSTNPLSEPAQAGPGMLGKGHSLYFDGTNQAVIPHSSYYEVDQFTLSMWIYLLEDSTGAWRMVLQKGQNPQEMTPTLLFWPRERRLHVRVSTEYYWNEGLDSTGLINLRRWSHIAVTASGQLLQFYLNSYLDRQVILNALIKNNQGDIYLGKTNWHQGFNGFIDDLRIYSSTLHEQDLSALAAPAIPLASSLGVMLSCQLCNYHDAEAGCLDNWHMCSLEELYAGPYEMARAMGWFRFTAEIWTRNTEDQTTTTSDEMQDPDLFKVGICCKDYE